MPSMPTIPYYAILCLLSASAMPTIPYYAYYSIAYYAYNMPSIPYYAYTVPTMYTMPTITI